MGSTRIGMVRCEHCGRQFNPHSAARHIPWCEKQKQERNKHRLSNEKRQALERYKWRISYRPSNQMNGHQSIGRPTLNNEFNDKIKKSSVNSSATLSSPSASSSASIASANDGYHNHQQRQQQRQRAPNGHRLPSEQASAGQLQRSISSLTLTKRQALARPSQQGKNSWAVDEKLGSKSRTKSTNDLSNMGEMVETLARRVDEIYAQNQLLLASIPKGSVVVEHSQRRQQQQEEESDKDNGTELVKCHHCKANCFEEANYCHKCGCRLKLASPSSPG